MKTGQNDKLRDLADRIKRLTDIAYPQLDRAMRAILALDQFKRCVSTDLSVFMISRPPMNLDDAVTICSEYVAAASSSTSSSKGRKVHISSATMDEEMEVNAFEPKPLTKKEMNNTMEGFQKTLTDFMKSLMTTCADAIKKGVDQASTSQPQTTSTPKKNWNKNSGTKKTNPGSKDKQLPPSPCYLCNELHWIRDCPKRKDQQAKDGTNKKQGNSSGPQQ
jgi:hypothetical protein